MQARDFNLVFIHWATIYLIRIPGTFKRSIDAYREAARQNGYDPSTLPVATAGFFFIADDAEKALDEYYPHINKGMERTKGRGFPHAAFIQGSNPHNVMNVGSPQQIIEKILYQHEQFGHQRYIAQMDFGGGPREKVIEKIEIIGTEILPAIRKYTAKS